MIHEIQVNLRAQVAYHIRFTVMKIYIVHFAPYEYHMFVRNT